MIPLGVVLALSLHAATGKLTVPVVPGFVFDGAAAELTQQFYTLYAADPHSASKIRLASVPAQLTSRLSALSLEFDELPGLLQRALLWDAGLVFEKGSTIRPVQVYTRCGSTMDGIAVSIANYRQAGCKFDVNCPAFPRNGQCSGDQIATVALCATDNVKRVGDLPMWATNSSSTAMPEPNLVRHQWKQQGVPQLIFAIHTMDANEKAYGECPKSVTDSGIIIPCVAYANSTEKWCAPEQSDRVTIWLQQFAANASAADASSGSKRGKNDVAVSDGTSVLTPSPASGESSTTSSHDGKSFNVVFVIPIVAAVLVVGLIATLVLRKKKEDDRGSTREVESAAQLSMSPLDRHDGNNSTLMHVPFNLDHIPAVASAIDLYDDDRVFRPSFKQRDSSEDAPLTATNTSYTGTGSITSTNQPTDNGYGRLSLALAGPKNSRKKVAFGELEQLLANDPVLERYRIPFKDLEFVRALAHGACGQVSLYTRQGKPLAVKRLLPHQAEVKLQLQHFLEEVRLTASLAHPNIIRFVGVAWQSVDTFGMVVEYLPHGDLLCFLRDRKEQISWLHHKLEMALSIARAVEYLHARDPPVIHRDIKAKNILLTDRLDVKLIDFGISRDLVEETMTAGVGTPYWSAPEVLDGRRYTEKSDIYSFGVLLCEMDTCEIPYQDIRSQRSGETMRPLAILNAVVQGTLRPTFTSDCPPRIRRAADACLDWDPDKRPTASELLQELTGHGR